MKYKRRSDSIDRDYWYYLGFEGLFGIVFGHRLNSKAETRKAKYIWKTLVKQFDNPIPKNS